MSLAWEAHVFKWANTWLYAGDDPLRWHIYFQREYGIMARKSCCDWILITIDTSREKHFSWTSCCLWSTKFIIFSYDVARKGWEEVFFWRCVNVGGKVKRLIWIKGSQQRGRKRERCSGSPLCLAVTFLCVRVRNKVNKSAAALPAYV